MWGEIGFFPGLVARSLGNDPRIQLHAANAMRRNVQIHLPRVPLAHGPVLMRNKKKRERFCRLLHSRVVTDSVSVRSIIYL